QQRKAKAGEGVKSEHCTDAQARAQEGAQNAFRHVEPIVSRMFNAIHGTQKKHTTCHPQGGADSGLENSVRSLAKSRNNSQMLNMGPIGPWKTKNVTKATLCKWAKTLITLTITALKLQATEKFPFRSLDLGGWSSSLPT